MAGTRPAPALGGLIVALLLLLAAASCSAFLARVPSHQQQQHQRQHQPSRRFVLDPSVVTDVVTDVVQSGGGANGPKEVAETMLQLLKGPSGVGIFGIAALSVRLYTYFTVQSYIAKLCTLFADSGTTVELRYGNSLRNLFYYEPGPGKMERLIVPTGDPKNIQTIAEVSKQLCCLGSDADKMKTMPRATHPRVFFSMHPPQALSFFFVSIALLLRSCHSPSISLFLF